MMAARGPGANREWYRAHFYDHPELFTNPSVAHVGTTTRDWKPKLWCRRCYDRRLTEIVAREESDVREGRRDSVRSAEAIKTECA